MADERSEVATNGSTDDVVRAKFRELDRVLQELVNGTVDVDSVRVTFSFVVGGVVVRDGITKEYVRAT